jgi:hypothetical protein
MLKLNPVLHTNPLARIDILQFIQALNLNYQKNPLAKLLPHPRPNQNRNQNVPKLAVQNNRALSLQQVVFRGPLNFRSI